jgi:beta-galactosidase/beta-glucuronidase
MKRGESNVNPHRIFWTAALLLAVVPGHAQAPRERQLFDNGWRFHLGDVADAQSPALPDQNWRPVDLPHDWSIEGPYSPKNAAGTAFLPAGIAWYRKTFQLPVSLRGRKVSIRFDGVYRDSTVWINGVLLGSRPYGYSTFEYDLTPHLHLGGPANVLAVRVDHSVLADSRWYPGSGIYRHVWLNVTGPVHIAAWEPYLTTPVATEAEALVSIETRLLNETPAEARAALVTSILNDRAEEVASVKSEEPVTAGKDCTFAQQVTVPHPSLWSPEHPSLYTAVGRVYLDGQVVDEQRTTFGIRTFYFSPGKGLVLNGRPIKMKGVCIHHDLGALGAAFFEEALERRLKRLQEIGVNAIRCSHNPMAPEFYDLCDRLGLLVMDEAFDEWIGGKRKWAEGRNSGPVGRRGYHEAFETWGVRDAQDMVLRDRNHPSIILWSIGNEIDYPTDPFVHPRGRHDNSIPPDAPGKSDLLSANLMPAIARRLIAAVKQFDGTRPVTMALADIDASNATGVANLLDVVGYNYLEQHYDRDHKAYPNRVIYGSENSRSLEAWRPVALNDYVGGQFLWTGINYLGEAERYPTHGSNAGLLDLEGFWKPEAYLRQALWSAKPMVYAAAWAAGSDEARMAGWPRNLGRTPLVERWGWTGDPRKSIPVEIYTNCDSVELLLNGRSLGEKPIADRLLPALLWAVPNEAGTLEVVGKRAGVAAARFQLKTIGQPERLELSPDLKTLQSDGRQVSTIEVRAVDRDGNRVPEAAQTVGFEVLGAGRLIAAGNADLNEESPATGSHAKLYQGRAVAVVRSAAASGKITVRATAPGLPAAEVVLTVVPVAP